MQFETEVPRDWRPLLDGLDAKDNVAVDQICAALGEIVGPCARSFSESDIAGLKLVLAELERSRGGGIADSRL